MKLSEFQSHQADEVVSLFNKSFSDSEGKAEGETVSMLTRQLIATTVEVDLFGYCAWDSGELLGCIFFSRFTPPINRPAFMLSPVAVSTNHQRKGIGQKLINFGLEKIKLEGVELVVTYGDPNYYSRMGFVSITESIISSPFALTHPHGWQAQTLTSEPLAPIKGETQCVEAFRRQEYW